MSLKCSHCQSQESYIRSGKNRSGTLRYRCLCCNHYFTPEPRPKQRYLQLKEQAFKLYLEGVRLRAIARKLHIHHYTVAQLVKPQMLQLKTQVEEQLTKIYSEGKVIQWDDRKKQLPYEIIYRWVSDSFAGPVFIGNLAIALRLIQGYQSRLSFQMSVVESLRDHNKDKINIL